MTFEHLVDEHVPAGGPGPGACLADERSLAEAVDRESPGLLALAAAFGADRVTAHRLVETAWSSALTGAAAALRHDPAGVALVRQMAAVPGPAGESDPRTAAVRRELRHALTAGRTHGLPQQRPAPRPRPARSSGGPLPRTTPGAAHLGRVAPPLRLVLVLRDVAGWSAADVQALIDVRPAAQRAMLGQARRALMESLRAVPA